MEEHIPYEKSKKKTSSPTRKLLSGLHGLWSSINNSINNFCGMSELFLDV